jgi:hypothetical protein
MNAFVKTIACVAVVLAFAAQTQAQAGGERFTATATMKSAKVSHSSPVTFQIDRFNSDADRDKLMAVVKRHKTTEIHEALAAMPDIGYVEMAGTKTPIKYAYARPANAGRLITVLTGKAILHLGADLPDAKPKQGYDLAFGLLVLEADNKGHGEMSPATKIKMDANGAIVTQDYGPATVHLTDVAKAK